MSPHDIHVLIIWIRTVLVIAVVCSNLFILLYSFSPWYRSNVGRLLMLQSFSLALALDTTLLFRFWNPQKHLLVLFWIQVVELSLIAIAAALLCVMLIVYYRRAWRTQNPKSAPLKSRR